MDSSHFFSMVSELTATHHTSLLPMVYLLLYLALFSLNAVVLYVFKVTKHSIKVGISNESNSINI